MQLHELNPHIRYARTQSTSLSAKNVVHICYDARLFFFEHATGSVKIGSDTYEISNNTCIYLPPLSHYLFEVKFGEETHATVINFDLVTDYAHLRSSFGVATLSNFDPSRAPAYPIAEDFRLPIIREMEEIRHQLSLCVGSFADERPFHRERASAYLKLCLLSLLQKSKEQARSPLCEKILSLANSGYQDPSLTNESIAKLLNYHPNHVTRVMKHEVGVSLRTYIMSRRLSAAKNLLLTTQSSISDIAMACGFASAAYFIKIFKEKNGMTPKDYRRTRIHTEL
jgi:AraC-like DNA-binding protein